MFRRKNKNLRAVREGTETPGDGAGHMAETYRTPDPARPLRQALRWSVVINIFSFALLLSTINALSVLAPLRRDVPYLVQLLNGDAVIAQLQPVVQGAERLDLVAEKMAVNWIVLAHELLPDGPAMSRRWGGRSCLKTVSVTDNLCGFMVRHSAGDVYRRLVEAHKTAGLQEKIAKHIARRVLVDAAPIRKGPDEVEVRFTVIEEQVDGAGKTAELQRRSFIANVWYEYRPLEVAHAERFVNPLGFMVVNWVRTQVVTQPGNV